MKLVLTILMVLLSLPVFAGSKKNVAILDPNCEKMADVVEGLAKLKAIGYSVTELSRFTTETTVQEFPIQSLKTFVHTSDKPAHELRAQLSALCNAVGFDTYNKFLLQEEQLIIVKDENTALKERVTALEEALKEQQAPKKVPTRK